jgi:hypothetical protein
MSARLKLTRSKDEVTFDSACKFLEPTLRGGTREEIVADLSGSKVSNVALVRLCSSLRSNVFINGKNKLDLAAVVRQLDDRTRQDGFHVLHDWNGKTNKLNEDTIPVDVLQYILVGINGRGAEHSMQKILATLLDYYFLYVLALLSLRVWDEGNADSNLDRLNHLLQDLQGPGGSGQLFADNAETLLFIATSHYEPDEGAYEKLKEKVSALSLFHRLNIAVIHSVIMGCHLRYGFEAQYARDLGAMRKDNAPDYLWLRVAVLTLMRRYSQMHDEGIHGVERQRIVEGILNALSSDARAFASKTNASLGAHATTELSQFCELFQRYRRDLFDEFENHRPRAEMYSPLSFYFNFPHNVLKAMVVNTLLDAGTNRITLNDLLTDVSCDERVATAKQAMARTLMGYARSSPDTVGGRPVPAIVYDPNAGVRNFAKVLLTMK